METIRLTTWIQAPVERCFKLSVSVDLHLASAGSSGEVIVGGVASGLMGPDDRVTWRGRHFGMNLTHEALIDRWRPFSYFRDVMVSGAFRMFEHEHHFAPMDDGTRMRDEVRFAAPMGALGRMIERRVLRPHLIKFLQRRNAVIKRVAESDEWQRYLGTDQGSMGSTGV